MSLEALKYLSEAKLEELRSKMRIPRSFLQVHLRR